MTDFANSKSVFLQKIESIVEENLADENFGVSELAEMANMSRSNLLRKVKKETDESVSVLIRNVRLGKAKVLLQDDTLTVSEVSYQVGFKSTSYFTKCFREFYGHTPGQIATETVEKEEISNVVQSQASSQPPHKRKLTLAGLLISVVVFTIAILLWVNLKAKSTNYDLSKSIAILPFKNDSNDSSNEYFMNGLMGAILDNFQKIEDIEISSRTTIEKYSGNTKTIPEMSKELNVSYFLEGSGQKVGNEVLLTIQLIEGPSGRQLWSQRYHREIKDIFGLQMEVAKSIADEINVIITPAEQKRIEKVPTENLVAYDYYLKGLSFLQDKSGKGLQDGIEQFKKAIQEDGQFTSAYAYVAISYYYLDQFKTEKRYTEEIKNYADTAMELDSDLGESLIAQALYYMQIEAYEQAIISFEEVLAYYPNTGWIHNFLSNIYGRITPDTEKYLLHSLKGLQSIVSSADSSTSSYTYLHLGNALSQAGFISEAETYVEKSLAYNPDNISTQYLDVYIDLARDFDLQKARKDMLKILRQDTSRLDLIQEVAKVSYALEDYEEAWDYYKKLIDSKNRLEIDVYQNVDIVIGYVLEKLGRKEEANAYYDSFLTFAENDVSLYKNLHLALYYATTGKLDEAISYLDAFSEVDNYQYWFVIFLEDDPVMNQMREHPRYASILKKINNNFWSNHNRIRSLLEDEKIIPTSKPSL